MPLESIIETIVLYVFLQKSLAGLKRINLEGLRWRVFDAKARLDHYSFPVLGRLASQISTIIQAKDKPTYTPYCDDGDICVVLNAKDVCVTKRKITDKYIGHLKETSLKNQMAKDPTEVIRKVVLCMLPRNKLRDVHCSFLCFDFFLLLK
ncbi:hypothetical protein SADUNF_Sadunf07G0059800 [Salix dunnii]|uniref:Ribosomal protein L13 n=1 Tax=Salix dunnii TaxID=1413687 RepID=A0A835K3F1_9ROSI|nr:hypothetical protein SADUNF_Sadunf07G0059800 [Salix dunnii]